MDAYAEIKWVEFSEVFEEIKVEVAGFERECRNLTRGLRGWKAYKVSYGYLKWQGDSVSNGGRMRVSPC